MENINFRKTQEAAGYGVYEDMRKQGNHAASIGDVDAFDAVEQVQYKQDISASKNTETVMNNFEEYRRDMQEKAKAEQKNAAQDEHEANEEAKEIAKNITSEEIEQLRMMGIDVDSASLSDLMDIVNHMRREAHKEAFEQTLAQAKVQSGDYDNLMITGSGVQTAGGEVEINNVDVMDVVMDETSEVSVENRDIMYLLKNQLPLNRENLYKAHFSGQHVVEPSEQTLPDGMEEQLKKVILQAGIPVDDVSMNGAKQMLLEDIPVTTDTMRQYMQLREYEGRDISEIAPADVQVQSEQETLFQQARELCQMVWSIDAETIAGMVQENQPISIASAYAYQMKRIATGDWKEESEAFDIAAHPATEQELRAITAMRQMEEIRLSMTEQAAGRMLKADINIDTRELSQVVAELRTVERQLTRELFARKNVAFTDENVNIYREMQQSLRTIGEAPAERLGRLLKTDVSFTTRNVAEVVGRVETGESAEALSGMRIQREFAQAERSYEAVGTAPRADMGDSIRKAFGNIEELLQEMDLPVTEEHVRAVRILGYNSIAITEDSVQQVMEYDRQVNDLMDACYPEAVLGMIRDGINPLDMPIEELNATLRQKQYHAGVTEAENFATYLRDMEKQGDLSAEERESYIGIYRMLNKLAKSGDREAGYLFANGSRLTVRNLLTAMRSRKAAGLDVAVDDSFGMLTNIESAGKKIDAQIERAFSNSWEALASEPEFEEAEQLLQTLEMEESAVNMKAAVLLLQDMPEHTQTQDGFYDLVSDILKKLKFRDETEEELIDQETGAMAESMTGEDIPVSFSADNLLQILEQQGDLSLTYADMREQLTELLYQNASYAAVNSGDVQSAKVIQAGFHILGKMAEKNQYQLPVETTDGTKIVNLTLIHDMEQAGTIQIRMNHEKYESLSADISLDADGVVYGEVLAGTSDGNAALLAHTADYLDDLAKNGYPEARISFGQRQLSQEQRQLQTEQKDGASNRKLMETAVFFVKALAALSDI